MILELVIVIGYGVRRRGHVARGTAFRSGDHATFFGHQFAPPRICQLAGAFFHCVLAVQGRKRAFNHFVNGAKGFAVAAKGLVVADNASRHHSSSGRSAESS